MTRLLAFACIALCLAVPEIRGQDARCKGVPCVCYHSEGDDLGCFMMRTECGEDLSAEVPCDNLPDHPADIATTFLLYDKENSDEAVEMRRSYPQKEFFDSGFDTEKENKILVQGIWSPNFYGLLEHIKEEFFKMKKFNIFMVNWVSANDVGTVDQKKIERTHLKPSQNARVVGVELGMFLKYLHDKLGVEYKTMHLVGFNFGAHVAGYAGKYINKVEGKNVKLARITALGPSSPHFEFPNGDMKPPECRLDRNDAAFVDAIHADLPSEKKITIGMISKIGHIDFYPNHGKDPQPGCKHMFCSHGRPMEYFEQSIKGDCEYRSEPCTWKNSPKCPKEGCPVMGYHTDKNAKGYYCVEVTDREPFCEKRKLTTGKENN